MAGKTIVELNSTLYRESFDDCMYCPFSFRSGQALCCDVIMGSPDILYYNKKGEIVADKRMGQPRYQRCPIVQVRVEEPS